MGRLNRERVEALTVLFAGHKNYTFMNAELGTIGAVAWVRCNIPDCDCFKRFSDFGLTGEEGPLFGATKNCML